MELSNTNPNGTEKTENRGSFSWTEPTKGWTVTALLIFLFKYSLIYTHIMGPSFVYCNWISSSLLLSVFYVHVPKIFLIWFPFLQLILPTCFAFFIALYTPWPLLLEMFFLLGLPMKSWHCLLQNPVTHLSFHTVHKFFRSDN